MKSAVYQSFLGFTLLCIVAQVVAAQERAPVSPVPAPGLTTNVDLADKPRISLSPAVVMAHGGFGQGLTQTLTLTNQTSVDFPFEMVANDVVVRDGQRVFVEAGQLPDSIAASAVFSSRTGVVKANSSASVDVRVTIPNTTGLRAIVAIFRGTQVMRGQNNVGMTASLGALITFNLSNNVKLETGSVSIDPPVDSSGVSISQELHNSGAEPVLPEGVAAFLDKSGHLTAKVTFEPQRLLPGEKLDFKTEYTGHLPPGQYRVLCSFQFEGKTITSEGTYVAQ